MFTNREWSPKPSSTGRATKEPIRVLIRDYFAYELRATGAEPFKRLVDAVYSEHDGGSLVIEGPGDLRRQAA
jgi:hypothetical protein